MENGADANFHYDGFDKLFVSCEETIKFLIEKASAFNIVRTNFSTVLQFLILHNEEMFFKLINSGTFFEINARNPYGSTLLHIAIQAEKMKIVEKLVDCGAYLKINSVVHNTPLNCAISVKNTEIVRFLLDRGAPLNCRGLLQYTPLHQAVAVKNLDIVKLLLSREANVDAKDFGDKTPLRVIDGPSNYRMEFQCLPPEAVLLDETDHQNRSAILRFLLQNSTDLSIQDVWGNTALHEACELENSEDVRLLLKKGIETRIPCNENCNVFHPSWCKKFWTIRDIFIDAKKVNEKMDNTVINGAAELFGYLEKAINTLKSGCDIVNIRNHAGKTTLHIAARKGSKRTVKRLLLFDADVNAVDKAGRTTLQLALEYFNTVNTDADSRVAKLLTKIIALKQNKGERVNELDLQFIKNPLLEGHFDKCKEEMIAMKNKRIAEGKFVSYYDFLARDAHILSGFIGNRALISNLKSEKYKEEFPIYSSIITKKIRLIELRFIILQLSEFSFKQLMQLRLPKLPDLIVPLILSYLGDKDLLNFSISLTSDR